MIKVFILLLFIATQGVQVSAQSITQTVKGKVTDKMSNTAMADAVVVVTDCDPVLGAITDANGDFKIEQVPVGKHNIEVTYIGYKAVMLSGMTVISGKELVLNVTMEEDLQAIQSVEVTAQKNQRDVLNEMSTVSTRTFSVEETQKFAAAVNDPGRMASAYAGVICTDDGNNNISIRGNSPNGLLWRMEGVDIPNPNHFASPATSGGGISIISAQLLANSDFSTGAFAAEYGNALSGVFDLKLRKGNNEKREYTFQAGLLGLDVAAEGPFKKGYGGSYLVNYRLSTLTLLSELGVNIGDGVTNFQDLSYNVFLPTAKAGNFSVFGFTGLSSQRYEAKKDSAQWEFTYDRFSDKYVSNTSMNGLKHVFNWSDKTYMQSSVVWSLNNISYISNRLDDDYVLRMEFEDIAENMKTNLNTIINHKFDARHSIRGGAYINLYDLHFKDRHLDRSTNQFVTSLDSKSRATTMQTFAQWRFRINESLTLNTGFHYLHLLNNNTYSVEPRVAIKYNINEIQSLSLGYGRHSQIQPIGIYDAQVQLTDGSYLKPNKNLGFNKADHIVLAYDRNITKHIYAKVEAYYQNLFNIAVEDSTGSVISIINNEYDYITEPLTNQGNGRNYGLELTVEQRTYRNLYFLLSGSLFNSEYSAMDKVWRNTRFNTNYSFVITAGKEWSVGKTEKNKTLGVNLRSTFVGGMRNTPIDISASMQAGETMYDYTQAYEGRASNYFRTDVRISLKRNFKSMTTTLSLDVQNATNNQNVMGSYFDVESGMVKEYYNVPVIPILAYKMEF
ncbi:MAG: carboxypeptidase regulatory-like domain-containing protein [Flavobacteriales bacterium]